jgi:hypothetical protein
MVARALYAFLECYMGMFDFFTAMRSREYRWAWLVAIVADLLQVVAWPFFGEGGLSAADAILDFVVAAILSRLLGWHWAFLPTFVVELIPGLDLFPTWTAAVFYVTRQHVRSKEPEIILPGDTPLN